MRCCCCCCCCCAAELALFFEFDVSRFLLWRAAASQSAYHSCPLAVRVDALGEGDDASLGIDARSKVEARLRQLEGGSVRASAPNGAPKKLIEVVSSGNGAAGYSAAKAGHTDWFGVL